MVAQGWMKGLRGPMTRFFEMTPQGAFLRGGYMRIAKIIRNIVDFNKENEKNWGVKRAENRRKYPPKP